MSESGIPYDVDEWDCLYCKLVTICPYGQAVAGHKEFCRLETSCFQRIPIECDACMPPEIEQCLVDIYGFDELATTDELAIFFKIHM